MDRDHHCRIFASLGFVDRNSVGKFQFFQLFKAVFYHSAFVKFHFQGLRKGVDGPDHTGIAVENENDRTVYLYWSDGNYFYELNSTVYSVGNLIKIAESVK